MGEEFFKVILREIDARLFMLLDLLEDWLILVFYIKIGLVQMSYAVLVIFLRGLKFVFSVDIFVHGLLHSVVRDFTLELT